MTTTLVLGGVRSGKSRHAESLLRGRSGVTYVATGPTPGPDDPEWQARIAEHQARRPGDWTTVETTNLPMALMRARGPVLVECLATWVTAIIDEASGWDDYDASSDLVARKVEELAATAAVLPQDVVLVSNETGMGVVPPTASGRLFRDALGHANARVGAMAERVHLVVAGRVLDLSSSPRVS